jgi:hypothetical protein
MRSNAKAKVGIVLGLLAMTLSAHATIICCRLKVEPEHDWTVRVSGHRFGFRGWHSSTEYIYGTGSFSLPLPFYGVVTGAGAFSAAAGSCILFMFRRKVDEPGDE